MATTRSIDLRPPLGRILLVTAAVALFALAWFTVRWTLGHTIGVNAPTPDIAEFGEGLAPSDSRIRLVSGTLLERTFLAEDLAKSLKEFETAAALSPNDFRVWIELGRAYERSGDDAKAEACFRRASELAPNYSRVQWTLGNFLLRQDRSEEGFKYLRDAARGDNSYAGPAAATAWQIYGGDLAQIRSFFGESGNLNAALASLLASEKRFDEALAIWQSLPAEARQTTYRTNGETIYRKMLEAGRHRVALRVYDLTVGPDDPKFTAGSVTNGGFEDDIRTKETEIFEWQIAEGTDPQVGIDDSQKRGGTRSLTLVFNGSDGRSFRQVAQTVAVEPGRSYVFDAWFKADLKTNATMKWEVVNAADQSVLASTPAIAATADWSGLKAEFTVPSGSEAVTIRLVRTGCTLPACPISGRVWFDDLSISAR